MGTLFSTSWLSSSAPSAAEDEVIIGANGRSYVKPANFVRLSKEEKRKRKREARKLAHQRRRRERRRKRGDELREYEEQLTPEALEAFRRQKKVDKEQMIEKMQRALSASLRIAVDLDFADVQSDRDLNSLAKQLGYFYSDMKRKMDAPPCVHLCAFTGKVEQMFQACGVNHWMVHRSPLRPAECFPDDVLVYLSPDAEEVLESVDDDKVYVIGGIVDRTVTKNLTKDRATEAGASGHARILCRRLPVQEYIKDRSKHVLNVDTAMRVLVEYQLDRDWKRVMESTVPQRLQCKGIRERRRRERRGVATEGVDSVDDVEGRESPEDDRMEEVRSGEETQEEEEEEEKEGGEGEEDEAQVRGPIKDAK